MRWCGKEKLVYLWKASAGRRKSILLSSGVGTGGVLLSLAFIYVSKWSIDTVTADVPGSLWRPGAWLVGLLVLQLLCDVLDGWLSVRLQIDTGNGLRHRLFAHLLYSRWNSMEAFHTGDVVNRIERDVSTIVGLLTVSIPSLLITGVQFVAAFIFLSFCHCSCPWHVFICGV